MATPTDTLVAPEGNEYFEGRKVHGKGYGCFAKQPISQGTRILAEDPILALADSNYSRSDVEKAGAELTPEQKKVYFSLHSSHGQDPSKWPSKILDSVHPCERKRIEDQHEGRIGKEATWLSIFQTNCMEIGRGVGVFPRASRFNHSCNPNACFYWNAATKKETIHAMKDIAAGEQITLSYCDMTHDKPSRAYELKHYGFVCDCPACSGDENDETSFTHQSAIRRFRLQELDLETQMWRVGSRPDMLLQGAQDPQFVQRLLEMAALHTVEGERTARLASIYLDIAVICEHTGDLKMAEKVAAKAVKIKRDCQGADFPNFYRYTDVLERVKAKLGKQETEDRA
ncbi:hypothetical protein yc1106_05530 [Curvularia clavata]|uniref:SET domain-containing protein n=1 Tax=Curvularia clavata TaxID=95742 RepID=A0A9Q8Z9M0_CURCL|nr:hypothetical protein yc1106_05530 [Curvularia clavata]